MAAKSEKTPRAKAGFGSAPAKTTFGTYGRRMVKNACGVLSAEFGTKVVFGTLTLPGSTTQARQSLSLWSGKLIELLSHWLRSKSTTARFVWVWEFQKSGALHLHFALGDNDILKLRFFERKFRTYVHKLFATLSRLSGVDMFARATGGTWRGDAGVLRSRIETIRKSVKRYMAKYLTKAEGEGQNFGYPSRWWGMSAPLKAAIYAHRLNTVFSHSDLECLVATQEQVRLAVQQTKVTHYMYACPYSPHSLVILIYPPDDQAEHMYEALQLTLWHWAATFADAGAGQGWLQLHRKRRQ
jgi:hypothetical protein